MGRALQAKATLCTMVLANMTHSNNCHRGGTARMQVYGRDGDLTRVSGNAPGRVSRLCPGRTPQALPKSLEFTPKVVWKPPKKYFT